MSAPRSCDELGLCQARTPCCTGCAFGPAEAPENAIDRQIGVLMKWVLVWAAGTATLAAVAFVAGALL